jgi:hypothetical protein
MKHDLPARWSTASFGDSVDTSPGELSTLGEHLGRCRGTHARWFALRCGAESMHRFVASRVVTTLVVMILLIGALSWAA